MLRLIGAHTADPAPIGPGEANRCVPVMPPVEALQRAALGSTATKTLCHLPDQLRPKMAEVAAFTGDGEVDALGPMDFRWGQLPCPVATAVPTARPLELPFQASL